ncbi:hypothetical protein NA57DRAFT_74599 [Rhizodiscina lignyota]|uniref:Uncharacterized protein n=1 Tax=Rhizodiscina lignyota TaxID=1504668 RepID=A0A9P4M7S6_9PEZI|nr:hypothetical protein NA57DRAFT_74599 [Rhizodiscina lignyota]
MLRTNLSRRFTPSSRILILAALLLTVLYLISATARIHLRDGKYGVELKEHPTFNPLSDGVGELVLRSRRHPEGAAGKIDHNRLHERIFNPTLLELPKGSKHNFIIICRQGQELVTIKEKEYKKGQQVAFFGDVVYDEYRVPHIIRQASWKKYFLEDVEPPEHHCKSESHIMQYIGPEDGKLYWTREGAPILMFTNQVPYEGECQGMFFVDVRAVVPDLVEFLGDNASKLPPIKYKKPIQLRRQMPDDLREDGSFHFEREKNWVPFQTFLGEPEDDPLMFSAHLVEPRIYKYVEGERYVEHVGAPETPQMCVEEKMAHGVHQGTPMLSITMCNRGECQPDIHNTVLMGLVQKRRSDPVLHYDKKIVTWNASSPFEFRSISKLIKFTGTEDWGYTWTGSMVYYWNTTEIPENRSHGFLDDEVWLSFGIADRESGWIDVQAKDLVEDHVLC